MVPAESRGFIHPIATALHKGSRAYYMYKGHIEFFEWVAKYDTAGIEQRSRVLHTEWLKKINCPIIIVDGTKSINEILKRVGLSNG